MNMAALHQHDRHTSPYHYCLRRNEIRLVTIHPGQWKEPLICSLSNHSLDDVPEYSALSYARGSARVADQITLDGIPWRVTIHWAHALHFLRQEVGHSTCSTLD